MQDAAAWSILSPVDTHRHAHTHTLSLSHTHTLNHTHIHTHSLSLFHTLTNTHPHTRSHFLQSLKSACDILHIELSCEALHIRCQYPKNLKTRKFENTGIKKCGIHRTWKKKEHGNYRTREWQNAEIRKHRNSPIKEWGTVWNSE